MIGHFDKYGQFKGYSQRINPGIILLLPIGFFFILYLAWLGVILFIWGICSCKDEKEIPDDLVGGLIFFLIASPLSIYMDYLLLIG